MKHFILKSVSLTLVSIAIVGTWVIAEYNSVDVKMNKASIQYGNRRPFSFYYPYSYQYYYPRPQYHGTSSSCYWVYTHGGYVYYCN